MRLVAIEPELISFFNEYSFAEAPPLPNYSHQVLSRLPGKVIKNADELRGHGHHNLAGDASPKGTDRDETIILITGYCRTQ